MICNRWDIFLALFPFIERHSAKGRPVAILSDHQFNAAHDMAVVVMITTAPSGGWPSDYALRDLEPTGLRAASFVRWKIVTLSLSVFSERIGNISVVDRTPIATRIAALMPPVA